MKKAFDTLLQTVVTAKRASENSDNEAFRYECLHCGEEVFLAAQDSIYKATHFRHRSGNNDKDCDYYLGQPGGMPPSDSRKNKQERVEFYYNNHTKCFYVSFNFSEEEISEYENAGAALEIRNSRNAKPFYSTNIDHSTFSDGVPEWFVLERYAVPYYISNTQNNKKREYNVFQSDSPSFFKILNNNSDDSNYKAKLIRSKTIYTGVRYFIAWPRKNTAQIKLRGVSDVICEEELNFTTFGGTTVWGLVVTFQKSNALLGGLLHDWGFNLKSSESVSLLWPPAYEKNEELVVSSSQLYLHSSFKFQGFGNINISDKFITEISDNVTKISLNNPIHILKKNVELEIDIEPLSITICTIEVRDECASCFEVPKENSFFLFSEFGTDKLSEGQKVFLTPSSHIAEYAGNSLKRIILFSESSEFDIEKRFFEIMSNYWITEDYREITVESLPQSIMDYLVTCKGTMCINKAVEQLIKGEENERPFHFN